MFCPQCGNELKAGARFCSKCGNGIGAQKAEANSASGSSSSSVNDGNISDAASTAPVNVDTDNLSASSKTSSSTFKYAFAVLAILVLVFAVVRFIGGGSGGTDDGQNTAVQEQWTPTNFEEWAMTYEPNLTNTLRNDLLKSVAVLNAVDVGVTITGNQLNITYIDGVASTEVGFLGSLLATYLSEGINLVFEGQPFANYSEYAAYLQNSSGFPVTIHVEERFSDGPLVNTYDFNASGRLN